MKYEIKKIGRTVELDDKLVETYRQVDEIRDVIFSIYIKSKYGPNPTTTDISDKELSNLCNELLLSELKALSLLPKALKLVEEKREELSQAAKQKKELDFTL